ASEYIAAIIQAYSILLQRRPHVEKEGLDIVQFCLLHKCLRIREPDCLTFRGHCREHIPVGSGACSFTIVAVPVILRTVDSHFPMNNWLIIAGEVLIKSRGIVG